MDSSDSDPTSSSTAPTTTIDGTQGGVGNGPSYGIDGKIMLGSVVILFAAIIIVLWFHSYACWLLCCCRRRRRRLSSLPLHQAAAAAAPALRGGLDVSVLKTLHTFTFNGASKNLDSVGNCPVCLSEFEEGEAGRALPKCGHAFHVECIDMWFQTHSNCPICRAPVQADIPAAVSSPSHGNEDGNSSSGNCPVEQVGISVEAPPSMEESYKGSPEELGSGSDGGNRAKSPGTPVLYMKKDLDHLVYMNFGAGQAGNFG